MARSAFIILVAAFALTACVGDGGQPNDAGGNGDVTTTTTDGAAPDASSPDTGPGNCVFGTSHFDDGCKFGP
jgi:hypothetical protein